MKIQNHKIMLLFFAIIFFTLPFFWFKPGEIDIGGDSGRLYFYDPVNLLKNSVFTVLPYSIGTIESRFFNIPLISGLAILIQIIHSPYVLNSLYNGMKIVIGFLAIYGIVKELLGNKLKEKNVQFAVSSSSILAGFFYVFNPAMTENYVRAILSHDQVFLNPLLFYFLLKYFITLRFRFLSLGIMVSLLFSHNFSWASAPAFFAFYPVSILFLITYTVIILKCKIPWKGLTMGLLLFLGFHAFHLLTELSNLFSSGSYTNTRVFDKSSILAQIGYFYGVLGIPKLSFRWFAYSTYNQFTYLLFLIPMVVLFGLLLNKKNNKIVSVIGLFFLLTFYLVNAKITNVGVEIYKNLFYIPGFSMFRNYYGQFQFVYYFFYSLFFGVTVFYLMNRLRHKFMIVFSSIIVVYFVVSSWQFIRGQLVNQLNVQSTSRVGIVIDPKYETALGYIRSIPNDAKILLLPSTDYDYQVVHGLNNGAFVGRSMVGQLTGKKDFAGYQDLAPYSEMFWKLSKEKNYDLIKPMLGLLNIQYIFYNSDSLIYDSTFPEYPYSTSYARKYLPKNQKEYKEYVDHLTTNKIFEKGPYQVYRLEDKDLYPHIYSAQTLLIYDDKPAASTYEKSNIFFDERIKQEPRAIYLDRSTCKTILHETNCGGNKISQNTDELKIQFQKINSIKYRVKILGARNPYVLVFSEAFHNKWKVLFSSKEEPIFPITTSYLKGRVEEGNIDNKLFDKNMLETLGLKSLPENKHITVNGYANAWYITPQDANNIESYDLIIEMTGQRLFWLGAAISIVTFFLFFFCVYRSYTKLRRLTI